MGLRLHSSLLKKADDEGNMSDTEILLQEVIAAEDPSEFVNFIQVGDPEELTDIEPKWISLLAKEMARHAGLLKSLVKRDGDIPKMMCPSLWESNDLNKVCHFPVRVMDICWTLEMMIDEYFGLCYGRENYREGESGSGERFPVGIRSHFAQMIQQKAGGGVKGIQAAVRWAEGLGIIQSHNPAEDSYAQGIVELKDRMQLNEVEEAQVYGFLTKQGFL